MSLRSLVALGAFFAIAGSLSAQPRRASIRGGGGGDRGKCTIEVVVDQIAEVEVRGDTANLRTVSGRPAEWRRFECSGTMPGNPAEFRFSGVDGRGRQELIRDPRRGGTAVVRIEDKNGGAEGYTFDLTWSGGSAYPQPQDRPRPNDRDYNRGGDPNRDFDRGRDPNFDRGRDRDRDRNGRMGTDQALRICQDAVRQQAIERFRASDVAFGKTVLDDTPGRRDWVSGTLDVRRRNGRDESYRFSCSVDFESGKVRSANIESR
jgi:hypothetical protein